MSIYLVLIVLILIQAIIFSLIPKSKNNNLFLVLAFIEIVFISGFRKSVGGDTDIYINLFNTIKGMSFGAALNYGYEKGFSTFCYLLGKISSNPQILIFASSFLITGLVFLYVYRNSKTAWLSVYLYITLLYFFNFMNLMRFALAIAILLQSIQYIERKKLIKFIFCVLIAGSFHSSAFLFIFAYFFGIIPITKQKVFIAIALIGLSTYLVKGLIELLVVFFPRYLSYKMSFFQYQGNLANFVIFGIYFIIIIFSLFFDKTFEEKPGNKDEIGESNLNIWLLTFGVGFSIAAIKIFILTRYTLMFTIVSIAYIPNLIATLQKRNNVILISIGLLVLTLTYTLLVLIFRPEWFLVTPYKNSLFY